MAAPKAGFLPFVASQPHISSADQAEKIELGDPPPPLYDGTQSELQIEEPGVSGEFFDASERIHDHQVSTEGSQKSESSTLVYDQEAFNTFQQKVIDLCQQLWQPPQQATRLRHRIIQIFRLRSKVSAQKTANLAFSVERMAGGLNRVMGISVADPRTQSQSQYMIRIPRFSDADPEREVAVLEYVRQHSSIPVATVVAKDFTTNNPISSPYVIQSRIPGFDLQNSAYNYPSLTFDQKKVFVEKFGRILLDILAMKGSAPGRVQADLTEHAKPIFSINHFEVAEEKGPGQARIPDELSQSDITPTYATTLEFLNSQFDRWKNGASEANVVKRFYMDRFKEVASQLNEACYLGDDQYSLCHLDLATTPRNVLAKLGPNGFLEITGILDWDEAIFCPKFLSSVAPMWIWAWSDEDEEDERKANDIPEDPQMQELKSLFERTVGPEYLHYAYEPGYRLARKLCEFALHGLHSSWNIKEADDLIEEWNSLQPDGMPLIESLQN